MKNESPPRVVKGRPKAQPQVLPFTAHPKVCTLQRELRALRQQIESNFVNCTKVYEKCAVYNGSIQKSVQFTTDIDKSDTVYHTVMYCHASYKHIATSFKLRVPTTSPMVTSLMIGEPSQPLPLFSPPAINVPAPRDDGRSVSIKCPTDKRFRAFVFTIPNYTDFDEHELEILYRDQVPLNLIAGREVCPTTGTPHLQGYVQFKNPRLPRFLCHYIHNGFIDAARGSAASNIQYCSKNNDVAVNHTDIVTVQNNKDDLGKQIYSLCSTLNPSDFIQQHPGLWVSYSSLITRTYNNIQYPERVPWCGDLQKKNVWIYGPTGTGKSTWARNQGTVHMHKLPNKWWNGYSSHVDTVIYEDYCPSTLGMAQYMKIWSDRYEFTAEVKNSAVRIYPGSFFFIVTSNYSIRECFEKEEDIAPLQRRFTQVAVNSSEELGLHFQLDPSILDR